MVILLIVCGLFLYALPQAAAADEGGVLFHASFDQGMDADTARGDAKAVVQGKDIDGDAPTLVEGVYGKSAHINCRGLMYKAPGNLNPESGSITFWFQPVDWEGSDDLMHNLFGTEMQSKCHIIIYRYFRTDKPTGGIFGKFAFYLRGGDPEDASHSLVIPTTQISDTWKRGEWRHIAATWGKREARLYVDGMLAGEAHGKLPSDKPQWFFISNNSCGKSGVANLIDEFRVYDRVLELRQIAAEYGRGRRALAHRQAETVGALPAPEELGKRVKVGSLLQDSLKSLFVRVDASELPIENLSALRVRMDARTEEGRIVAQVEDLVSSDLGVTQARLSLETAPPGSYKLVVVIEDDKKSKVAMWSKQFDKPDAPWLGNDIGKSSDPVKPFVPVRVQGGKVHVWGKRYEVANQLILNQAVVQPDPNAAIHRVVKRFHQEAPLLAAPVRLVGTFGAATLKFDAGAVKSIDAKPTHALFQAMSQQGPITANTALRFDDDSVITADIALEFAQPTDIRDLRLEIPLKSEYCRWMNWTNLDGHRDASGAGAIPDGQGIVWKGVFHPLLWLGDDYRGFGYFCDSSAGWTGELTDPDRVLIRRDGETTTIVLRLIPEARAMKEAWKTKISFLATPARPLPPKWRGMSLGGNFSVRHVPYKEGCPMHVVYWWTSAFFESGQDHFSSPRTDTLRLDAIKEAITANGEEPIRHVFYT